MGPENKIKKMIEERTKKEEEMTDMAFLIGYLDILNVQIKQTQVQLTGARLHRKHVVSIIKKLKKNEMVNKK